jgi:glycosyltransferase involved in cell wall biosynthesis
MSEVSYSWLVGSNTIDQRLLDSLNSIQSTVHEASYEIILVLNGDARTSEHKAILTEIKNLRVFSCSLPGLTHSLNLGLQHARGEYVFRLDVGDLNYPNRVRISINSLEQKNADVLVTNMSGWKNGITNSRFLDLKDFILRNPIAHPTLCIRRVTLISIGGYEGWKTVQDFDLWIKLILKGYRIYYVADETVLYEVAGVGDSRDYKVAYKNMIGILAKYLFQYRTSIILLILISLLIKYFARALIDRINLKLISKKNEGHK